MTKEPKKIIKKRLLGSIEKREGKWIFVLKEPQPKIKIEYVPYWTRMA